MIQETLQRINNRLFGRDPVKAAASRNTRALAGGRVTVQEPFRPSLQRYIAHPQSSQSVWRLKNYTEEELLNLPVEQFMKVVTSISPEVNKAYTDFLRNCNESWGYVVEPASATPIMDDFVARLETKHHDIDVLWDRIYAGIYKGGAIFMELELNETADMAMDIAVMDPYMARYKKEGQEWRLGQWQQGKWKDLEDDPTVMYVPFNAGPNEPFGRSLMESAPLDVVRMLGVMNDFRRVLESQGWARADFEIDSERLMDFIPPEDRGNPKAEDAFIKNFINGVNDMYSNLKPNEGYGHLDIVKVNMPTGGQMNASFFGLVDGLMRLYDRRVGRATGSTPIKQHSNESVAETHAGEQRKDYRINISSVQSTTSGALSTLGGYVLRAEGVQGKVNVYFENTPDPEDVKRLEEAEGVKIENLKKLKELEQMGGIDSKTYQDAVNKYKSEKSRHTAGMRSLPTAAADGRELLSESESNNIVGSASRTDSRQSDHRHIHEASDAVSDVHICTHVNCNHPSHFVDDQRKSPPVARESQATGSRLDSEAVQTGDFLRAATISPDGSDQPLPPVPEDFEVNSAHLESAIEMFEETFPEYKNLLNARVTGMSQTDAIETVRQGDWVWNDLSKLYRNSKTKKRLTAEDLLEVRNDFIDAQRLTLSERDVDPAIIDSADARSFVSALVSGLKTVQEWLYEMRQKVRDIFNAQYMLGRGGRNAMFQADLDRQTEAIASQFDFLQAYVEQVRQGQLSAKQIAARAELYMEASTSAFEEGKASSHGVTLPEYPGDGNQMCGVRCRCTWILTPVEGGVSAFWTLNPIGTNHCQSCRENAAKWAPYTVKTGG